MPSWSRSERAALSDLLVEVGPEAPTLCEGWTARDLTAHLVLRERRPAAATGIVVKPLASYTERVQRELADQPWPDLVELLRSGPPGWSPLGLPGVEAASNTVEFFVHHEDVRRAQPEWQPRALGGDFQDDLWRRLGAQARLLLRSAPVSVVLRRPDGAEIVIGSGEPSATVEGLPAELLLFAHGRGDHARVTFSGDPDAIERLRTRSYGV